jgi:predicted DNA-binding transcriptional regulator YafY
MLRQQRRILQLDELLRNYERSTAQYLADHLEVSERTVRADIEFLRDQLHAPIKYSKKSGFHYEDPSWRLSTYPLTQGELFALTIGARMLQAYSGSAYRHELETAITRLSERLPEQGWVDLQKLAQEHMLFRSGAAVDLDPEIWQRLENACHQNRSVLMTYYTAGRNATSDRQLDPYFLHIYRGTNPYLIGYCHNRQMVRSFRIDRIRKIEVLPDKFVRDPTFDAQKYLDDIFQHEAGGSMLEIKIEFDRETAPYVKERKWHPSQSIEEYPDGSIALSMTVRGINDIKRWVLGYGKGAKVISPPELVNLVREEVAQISSLYTSKN